MAAFEDTLRQVVAELTNIQVSRLACGAAMTVLLYDFTLTWTDVSR
jgi:hypothetical protein